MSKYYLDGEGVPRVDENYQFIVMREACGNDVNLLMDSWDVQLACKMIVFGFNIDVQSHIESGLVEGEEDSYNFGMANCMIIVMNRILRLAKSAVAIGNIRENDRPENWISWARTKGYDTDHLSPQIAIERLENALINCEVEGLRETYRKQINNLTKLLHLTTTSAPTTAKPKTATKTNKLKNRTSHLDAEIEMAIKQALNPADKNSVWTKLFELANLHTGCMCGTGEKEIKYMDSGEVKFFKKRNFNERMNRKKPHINA